MVSDQNHEIPILLFSNEKEMLRHFIENVRRRCYKRLNVVNADCRVNLGAKPMVLTVICAVVHPVSFVMNTRIGPSLSVVA